MTHNSISRSISVDNKHEEKKISHECKTESANDLQLAFMIQFRMLDGCVSLDLTNFYQ